MNRLLEKTWKNRGYPDNWIEEIERRDHSLPEHIPDMVRELKKFHDSGEQIVLLSDFDMDGIMTGVVGYAGLKQLGFNVELFKPDTNQYGILPEEVDRLVAEYPNAKCVLTGDVGISEGTNIARLQTLGLEVLVTDHHELNLANGMPRADVVVDPSLSTGEEYFKGICGAHVMYLLDWMYAYTYCRDNDPNIMKDMERLRVFAGIGTMTDSMPLKYENRQLVRDAVNICQWIYNDGNPDEVDSIDGCEEYKRAFHGLYYILEKEAELNRIQDSDSIHEDLFSFYIGPAFNSIKRAEAPVDLAYDVFFADEDKAKASLDTLIEMNDKRKTVQAQALDDMLEQDQPYAPYIYFTDTAKGVRGLLANDMMKQTGMPTLVVSKNDDGSYSGSGRSPAWFDARAFLETIPGVNPAGHEQAFGVTFESEKACQMAMNALQKPVEDARPKEEQKADFTMSAVSKSPDDADVRDDETNVLIEYTEEKEAFRPFGPGLPEPVCEFTFNPKKAYWRFMGKDGQHVKCKLPSGIEIVFFNQASFFPDGIDIDAMPDITTVRGTIDMNVWMGTRTIQLKADLGPDMDQSGLSLMKQPEDTDEKDEDAQEIEIE